MSGNLAIGNIGTGSGINLSQILGKLPQLSQELDSTVETDSFHIREKDSTHELEVDDDGDDQKDESGDKTQSGDKAGQGGTLTSVLVGIIALLVKLLQSLLGRGQKSQHHPSGCDAPKQQSQCSSEENADAADAGFDIDDLELPGDVSGCHGMGGVA